MNNLEGGKEERERGREGGREGERGRERECSRKKEKRKVRRKGRREVRIIVNYTIAMECAEVANKVKKGAHSVPAPQEETG